MNMNYYTFKTEKRNELINSSWKTAQEWCNFVLFKPIWLPEGLIETSNKIRPESPDEEASHRLELADTKRALSIKQFLYDWATPAYDHPCLWRNAEISPPEKTPLPKPYLLGNNYLWFGLDYRRKPAATINLLRTQIEITTLSGSFTEEEIIQLVSNLNPVDNKTKDLILNTPFSNLTFSNRHQQPASEVPTSYFVHTRKKKFHCYPHAPSTLSDTGVFPGSWLINVIIKNYKLDSVFLFGTNLQNIQEVEYYFESLKEPGSYIRFLATGKDTEHYIHCPPQLGDQACHYEIHKLNNDAIIYHAWSKMNDRGSHSLVFVTNDEVINCIIKPAPWTTVEWSREICKNVLSQKFHR